MVTKAVREDIPNVQVLVKTLLVSHLVVKYNKFGKVIWLFQVQEMEQYAPPVHTGHVNRKEGICGHLIINHNLPLAVTYSYFSYVETCSILSQRPKMSHKILPLGWKYKILRSKGHIKRQSWMCFYWARETSYLQGYVRIW